MKKTHATVIGIVKFGDKILLLRRTPDRHSSPNKWQPVSGHIREKEAAEDAVLGEVKEETGLEGKIIKAGEVFEVSDSWGRWILVTFLVTVNSDKVKFDPKEHSSAAWIKPEEFTKFNLTAGFKENLESVGLQ